MPEPARTAAPGAPGAVANSHATVGDTPPPASAGAGDARTAAAALEAHTAVPRRIWPGVAALAAGLVVLCCASLIVGAQPLSAGEVLAVFQGRGGSEATALVWEYRLPRTIVAIVVGAALGTAGALIQAFTRNPLADPGIIGINAGSALAVTLCVAFAGMGATGVLVWPAFGGALLATLAVMLVAGSGRAAANPLRITLAGVALAAVLSGIGEAIRLTNAATFDRMRQWAAGSAAGRDLGDLAQVAPALLVGIAIALLLARALNAMALGDDLAAAVGVNVRLVRLATVGAVALLVGGAVAVCGPIGFIGLMVPHACRLIVGNDQRRVIPLSLLAAPVIMLGSDVLSRVILPGREVPVGVVTAFVGAPVLIALVTRRKVFAL
ncbi:iron ABC transporter permease [Brevibacterium sp. BRM-1]|uniref:FecCD family ABC transporter permease n=1 Tax=Brevibacterium sp. BRM-1 TaxID=2999062 RepID=UPI002281FE43|nr:iron ABC transporter permease [Brevibacterium sp. BRM-1]WAL40378.1 iron ABC transporter permease [Brevibacterium sp. BRM-1]